jgi:hypothetical protein
VRWLLRGCGRDNATSKYVKAVFPMPAAVVCADFDHALCLYGWPRVQPLCVLMLHGGCSRRCTPPSQLCRWTPLRCCR